MKKTMIKKNLAPVRLTAAAVAAAAVTLLASCGTFGGSTAKATPDEEAIILGTAAWNQKGPAAAKAYWDEIRDETVLATYTGYVQQFGTGTEYLAEAESVASEDEAGSQAAGTGCGCQE